MSSASVAKRYARALFDAAVEQKAVEAVLQDLKTAVTSIANEPAFQDLLLHPNVDTSVKEELLQKVFGGKVHELVMGVLILIVKRDRSDMLTFLLSEYTKIANEHSGKTTAIVYSPLPLTEQEAQSVANTFGTVTGKKVEIENVLEPTLIGGIQVRIGDRIYDGSLSGKLSRLQKTLQTTQAL
jgi:F-type H+-transporting ATPase subunit delta